MLEEKPRTMPRPNPPMIDANTCITPNPHPPPSALKGEGAQSRAQSKGLKLKMSRLFSSHEQHRWINCNHASRNASIAQAWQGNCNQQAVEKCRATFNSTPTGVSPWSLFSFFITKIIHIATDAGYAFIDPCQLFWPSKEVSLDEE